jgi:hypothetical protein
MKNELPPPERHDITPAMFYFHLWAAAMVSSTAIILFAISGEPGHVLSAGFGIVAGSVSTYTVLRVVPR